MNIVNRVSNIIYFPRPNLLIRRGRRTSLNIASAQRQECGRVVTDVKTHFVLLAALLISSGCILQGSPQVGSQEIPQNLPASISLWPGFAPGSEGQTSPEVLSVQHEPATQYVDGFSFAILSNVHHPSITPFFPDPAKATGAAIIVIPGGGHQFLVIEHEGYAVARVFADRGVAAFVLKYRLAKAANSPYKVEVHELMDVQRAIRLVRSRAADFGVDPARVGVVGFSARGQLSFLAATQFGSPVPGSNDAVDQIDCRPDFAGLLYGSGVADPATVQLPAQMPPVFMAVAYNDRPANSVNLAQLYVRFKQAGVPAELHIYNSGGHGFGVRPDRSKPDQHWTDLFMDWLGDRGLLKRP